MKQPALPIELILLNGNPSGPKVASIKNWIGKAVNSPIHTANEVLKRTEFEGPGVYIMKATPPEKIFYHEQVYIGESQELKQRIKTHLNSAKEPDYDSFVAFSCSDDSFDKGTIKYLEHRLIAIGNENKTSKILNDVFPSLPPYLNRPKLGWTATSPR